MYGQNIFDVALALYGSVEGVFALLVANPGLGVSAELEEGDELLYDENWEINPSIVKYLGDNGITPANGEAKLAADERDDIPFAIIYAEKGSSRISMDPSGPGTIEACWGDGKSIDTYELSGTPAGISHWFPDVATEKTVKLYGTPVFEKLAIKTGAGELRFLKEISIQQYSNESRLSDSDAKLLIKNESDGTDTI